MKAHKEHRIPISDAAIDALKALPETRRERKPDDLVFESPNGGKLSDATMNAVIDRINAGDAPQWFDEKGRKVVQHGFRSTFRDWCSERTHYPREVAEMALSHVIENRTEAAYRRGDLFEKRRRLMTEWARFLAKVEKPAKVIELQTKRA